MKKTITAIVITGLLSGGASFIGGMEYQKYEFKQALASAFNFGDQSDKPSHETKEPKKTAEVKEVDPTWEVEVRKDEMTQKPEYIISSIKTKDKKSEDNAFLAFVKVVDSGEERITMAISGFMPTIEGQDISSKYVDLRVRWDNEVSKVSFYHEYGKALLQTEETEKFIANMKNHKKVMIEIPLSHGGTKYFEFDTSDFSKSANEVDEKLKALKS